MELDPIADSPERAELRATVRRLVAEVAPPARVAALDEAEEFDDELFLALADLGAFAIGAPRGAGGRGDVRDQLVVVEELAAGPTSMAAFLIAQYTVMQVLGDVRAHADEHRAIAAATRRRPDSLCVRALGAGGRHRRGPGDADARDAGRGRGRLADHRAEDVDVGRFDSRSTSSSWPRTAPIERSPVHGVTMFLVPTDAPGVTIRTIDTFGIHGLSTCEVFFDDVVARRRRRARRGRPWHAPGVRDDQPRRAERGRSVLGRRPRRARARGRVRDGPRGVRQADRRVPGAAALAGRRRGRARVGAQPDGARRGDRGGRRATRACSRRWPSSSPAKPRETHRAHGACSSWAGWATRRAVAMQRYFRDVRLWSSARSRTRWSATASANSTSASLAPTDSEVA